MSDKEIVNVGTTVKNPKVTWECPDCGEEITGSPKEIAETPQAHYQDHRLTPDD